MNGNVTSSQDFRGMTAGREIREGDFAAGCQTPGRDDQCYSLVQHIDAERRQIGSGVAMRNVYPGYFLENRDGARTGHYFGLCNINHSGVQNIMVSTVPGNSVFDWGLFSYYLRAEPHFTGTDKRNAWRFIVDQLRNEL